jgi:hypothetical protein
MTTSWGLFTITLERYQPVKHLRAWWPDKPGVITLEAALEKLLPHLPRGDIDHAAALLFGEERRIDFTTYKLAEIQEGVQ